MKRVLVTLVAAVLAACGGGGGGGESSSPPSSSPPPVLRNAPLLFGFYGTGGDQLAKTASFVNVVMLEDWGDRTTAAGRSEITYRLIAQMQEARARGVTKVILSTGYVTMDERCNMQNPQQLADLRAQLDALDLTSMIVATYPEDEPDLLGCTDAQMRNVFAATKKAFDVPVAVIYSDHGTPGISEATWIGWDKYGHGPQLNAIGPDQFYIVISGGANPWREQPFASFSIANPRVALDLAFLYLDFDFPQAGNHQSGIGTNGMLHAYCEAGRQITGKAGAC